MDNSSHGADFAGSEPVEDGFASEQVMDDLKRRAADYLEQGKQAAAEMTEAIEQQIRQRPVEAVAVAAGIGLALGLLWSRRS